MKKFLHAAVCAALILSAILVFCGCTVVKKNVILDGKEDYESGEAVASNCIDSVIAISAGGSNGTAFIVTTDGYALTNYHVVSGVRFGGTVKCEFYDGKEVTAKYKYGDKQSDIAVIKIETPGTYIPAKLDREIIPSYGETLFAIGNSKNTGVGIYRAMVSIPSTDLTVDGITQSYIQLDMNINHGISGAPLINADSVVIGIVSRRMEGNGSPTHGNIVYGIGYAIPIGRAYGIMNEAGVTPEYN